MSHYDIWKECYKSGETNILILEEDITFLKDINLLRDYINLTSDSYECVNYAHGVCNKDLYKETIDKVSVLKGYIQYTDFMVGASFYSLNRSGMEKCIKSVETKFSPCDMVTWSNCEFYIPIQRLGSPIPIRILKEETNEGDTILRKEVRNNLDFIFFRDNNLFYL